MTVVDDDIDAEHLQAQIDVSMAFAHDLVTSWIKPSSHLQRRSNDVSMTQIREEELRRPPRLGVGAPIPSIPPLGHEFSKLKRRLEKGVLNDGVVESQPQDSSKSDHDDDEHKGRPTKRKTKMDPFGHEGSKKKRKADSEANPHNSTKHPVPWLTLGDPIMHNSLSRKEGQRMGLGDPDQRLTVLSEESEPSQETSVASGSGGAYDNSVPTSDTAEPLGISLLNLNGPPDIIENGSELNPSKRKRKRRRKKKTHVIASGDNS